jgi:hypothetical protein
MNITDTPTSASSSRPRTPQRDQDLLRNYRRIPAPGARRLTSIRHNGQRSAAPEGKFGRRLPPHARCYGLNLSSWMMPTMSGKGLGSEASRIEGSKRVTAWIARV